jgi:hypothetical protein
MHRPRRPGTRLARPRRVSRSAALARDSHALDETRALPCAAVRTRAGCHSCVSSDSLAARQAILATQRGILPDTTCVEGKSEYVNMFGYLTYDGKSYDGSCDFFGGTPPLPEGLGW